MKLKQFITVAFIGGASSVTALTVENQNKIQENKPQEEARLFSWTKTGNKLDNFDQLDKNYKLPETNSIDNYGDDIEGQESYMVPISSHSSSGVSSNSSPAVSALALLVFLYFLNLIQGTSGKKKREATDEMTWALENIDSYLMSIENFVDVLSDYVPTDEGVRVKESRSLKSDRSLEDRAGQVMDFFSSMWYKIIDNFFGSRGGISRNDYEIESRPTPANAGLWSMLGSKIGLVATLTDFLEDPSPTRVGRSNLEVERDEEDVSGVELAESEELTEEDKKLLPKDIHSRTKRFTDGMNVWYNQDNGQQHNAAKGPSSGVFPIYGMIFKLLKGAFTVAN